jgi:hypothetical protein
MKTSERFGDGFPLFLIGKEDSLTRQAGTTEASVKECRTVALEDNSECLLLFTSHDNAVKYAVADKLADAVTAALVNPYVLLKVLEIAEKHSINLALLDCDGSRQSALHTFESIREYAHKQIERWEIEDTVLE